MFFGHYIETDFNDYLNRYIKGIFLLKDVLRKIHVGYDFSEAFSNHTCRFWIEIDFLAVDSLNDEHKKTANECFHNMWNNTGSKFVSFSYKPQRTYSVNFEEIASFIRHYSFAQGLFEGSIKHILPVTCSMEIDSLESVPFFLYADHFLSSIRYSREEKDQEAQYRQLTGRAFNDDWFYHEELKKEANKYPKLDSEATISDEELGKVNACDVSHLRRFILSENIPFNIKEYGTIDNIKIDMNVLRDKMAAYSFSKSYLRIDSFSVIGIIDQKIKDHQRKRAIFETLSQQSGIEVGDYILLEYAEFGEEHKDLGIVKEITLRYDDKVQVGYSTLKKDLQESKYAIKTRQIEHVSYSMASSKFEAERGNLKAPQMILLMKSMGKRNTLFSEKKGRGKR